jgi:hypothetical protein
MSWRAFVAAMLLPCVAAAEGPVPPQYLLPLPELKLQTIPPGEDQIVPLRKGDPAPFAGQLFSQETALRWGNWMQQYQTQTPLLLQTYSQVCTTEIGYRDKVLKISDETSAKIQADQMARIRSLEEQNAKLQGELTKGPPFFQSRTFGIMLGVVSMVGVTALSIWAIEATSKAN